MSTGPPANTGASVAPITTAYHGAERPAEPSREPSVSDSDAPRSDVAEASSRASSLKRLPQTTERTIEEPLVYPAFLGTPCTNCDGFDHPFLDEPRVKVADDTPFTELSYFCGTCSLELLRIAGWQFEFTMRQLLFHLRNESCEFNLWFYDLQKGFSSDDIITDGLLRWEMPDTIASRQDLVDQLKILYIEKEPGIDIEIPQEVLDIKDEIRARLREANILQDLGRREFNVLVNEQHQLEFQQKRMVLYPHNHYVISEGFCDTESW